MSPHELGFYEEVRHGRVFCVSSQEKIEEALGNNSIQQRKEHHFSDIQPTRSRYSCLSKQLSWGRACKGSKDAIVKKSIQHHFSDIQRTRSWFSCLPKQPIWTRACKGSTDAIGCLNSSNDALGCLCLSNSSDPLKCLDDSNESLGFLRLSNSSDSLKCSGYLYLIKWTGRHEYQTVLTRPSDAQELQRYPQMSQQL